MDLVIAGSRGLGLTLPERHTIAGFVAVRLTARLEHHQRIEAGDVILEPRLPERERYPIGDL